jgi:hypothetical protein
MLAEAEAVFGKVLGKQVQAQHMGVVVDLLTLILLDQMQLQILVEAAVPHLAMAHLMDLVEMVDLEL